MNAPVLQLALCTRVQPVPNPKIWLVERSRSSLPIPPAGQKARGTHAPSGLQRTGGSYHLSAQIQAFQVRLQNLLSLVLVPGATAYLLRVSHSRWSGLPPQSGTTVYSRTRPLSAIDAVLVHQILRIDCCPAIEPVQRSACVLSALQQSTGLRASPAALCGGRQRDPDSSRRRRAEVPRTSFESGAPPRPGLPNNALTGCCLTAQRSSRPRGGWSSGGEACNVLHSGDAGGGGVASPPLWTRHAEDTGGQTNQRGVRYIPICP